MTTDFKDIQFPETLEYRSDNDYIPLEFYMSVFPVAKSIDIHLGYFSSNAIIVLNAVFAQFIYNGGSLRLIINNILSPNDKKNLIDNTDLKDEDRIKEIFTSLEKLKNEFKGGQHFFDCLRFLMKENRLEIIPVTTKSNTLSHYKNILLLDENNNFLYTSGSANFTANGILTNGESFTVSRSWGDNVEKSRIQKAKKRLTEIFSKINTEYIYLKPEEVKNAVFEIGKDKNAPELIEDAYKSLENYIPDNVSESLKAMEQNFYAFVEKINNEPHFPVFDGKQAVPRKYQSDAYNAWIKNNYHGIFAMATGTGKTITSLNCVLEEYKKTGQYNVLILVPTLALVEQWETEISKFNFKKYVLVSGATKWKDDLDVYKTNARWRNIYDNLIIISTYQSFTNLKFLNLFTTFQEKFTIIADEAHNIGATSIKKVFSNLTCKKRIALSATPKRIYDIEGTKDLERFFKDNEPYCYTYSLGKAIDKGFLTSYFYYPHIVRLNDLELEEYIRISKILLQFFDSKTGSFNNSAEAERLLLQRKRIIHKAINKLDIFREIVKQLEKQQKLKYCFTFAPEGDFVGDNSFEDFNNIIDRLIIEVTTVSLKARVNSYTSRDSAKERKEKLRAFSEGKIDMLFTMKAIDEGVDIPRAEIGIFTSSTGNPRQFIQRRGRLLRKHPDKKNAKIFDLIVIPDTNKSEGEKYFNMEKSLVTTELKRVAYFASLSENFYDSRQKLNEVMVKYNLNLDTIIKDLQI